MPAALGPRFVLEAGFLILLAVVVGFADLSPALIVLVMAIAWLLVALIEYFAWRQSPSFATATLYRAPAPAAVQEEVVEEAPPPPAAAPEPPPEPAPAEAETMIEPAAAPPPAEEAEATPASFTGFGVEQQRQVRHRLEPLQPRPRRRWILFGPYERPKAQAEGSSEEER